MLEPTVFIISAPSGAGKTSLIKALIQRVDKVGFSVSHTTRDTRPGETDGQDYYFVSRQEFEAMIADDHFLEYAEVFDHLYGTSRQAVAKPISQGKHVLLEIDWQGARQVREKLEYSISVFIVPPSLTSLEKRLKDRQQDSESIIQRRMRDAKAELAHKNEYDYVIVNDNFDAALDDLENVLNGRGDQIRDVSGRLSVSA